MSVKHAKHSKPGGGDVDPEGLPASERLADSIDQFCEVYGVGRTTAYEEIKDERLVARKVRGRTIILRIDSKSWADNLPKITKTVT